MHPHAHSFSPGGRSAVETRSDFDDAFAAIARAFSALAKRHLGTRTDVVLTALQHDTPMRWVAYPDGTERDYWRPEKSRCQVVTMSKLTQVERDYTA